MLLNTGIYVYIYNETVNKLSCRIFFFYIYTKNSGSNNLTTLMYKEVLKEKEKSPTNTQSHENRLDMLRCRLAR